jgi:hypothetical protein
LENVKNKNFNLFIFYLLCYAVQDLKQSDPEPSAYAFNPESRMIRQVNRSSLNGISSEKTLIILTEENLQGDNVYMIDDLIKRLEIERGMVKSFQRTFR